MMATYLGYVQGGKCRDTHAVPDRRKDAKGVIRNHYPQTHKQFWVIDELKALGIDAWCGRKIAFKRSGKNRYAERDESPFLPNYLFMEMTPEEFIAALDVKFLASTFQVVPKREVDGFEGKPGLDVFKSIIQAEFDAAERIDANSKAAVAEYTKGQLISAKAGPFKDAEIWFQRIVQTSHDQWPMIEGLVDMMGGKVPVRLDPLDVGSAD